MRVPVVLLALCLAGALAAPVWAETGPDSEAAAEAGADEERGVVPLGDRTRAWMERQRAGAEASPNPTGLTPPEDYRARRRHLDSFSHPIPPLFEFERLGEGG